MTVHRIKPPPDAQERVVRSASNPAASPEFLRTLWLMYQTPGVANTEQGRIVRKVLLGNPALPLDILRQCLLETSDAGAWFNPSVPLLLLSEPSPEYREAANRLLIKAGNVRNVSPRFGMWSGGLGVGVAEWAATDVDVPEKYVPGSYLHTISTYQEEVRGLARRLAEVFSLPWPEDR